MSLIEVRNLNKIYPDGTAALQEISFRVEKHEFVAVVGPSGSGKSTLLHILGFLDTQTSGEYFFDGKPISDLHDEEIARVRNQKMGFVFQMFNLLPRLTVFENVKLPLLYSGTDEARWDKQALNAIETVGLTHRKDHKSALLSGGEKQRAAIARALVNTPQIIFADEPTGNLDSRSGQMIMETLEHLNEEKGHTIILITHETYTAERARRVIHIRDGAIEKDERKNHRARTAPFKK